MGESCQGNDSDLGTRCVVLAFFFVLRLQSMKIAIDARAFYWTGIGRYIRMMLSQLQTHRGKHAFTLLVPEGKEREVANDLNDTRNFFTYVGVEPSYYSFKEQTRFLYQLRALQVDLVHFTHFNIPYFYRRPYVVTIHDITRFIFPGQKRQSFVQQLAYEAIFANAVSHAKEVIAVSRTTQRDMYQLPFRNLSRITTIHEGVAPEFSFPVSLLSRQKVRLLLGTDRPFFLFVGVWMNHKNLVRLLGAYQLVRKQFPEMALVITGKPVPGYSNLLSYVQEHHLEHDVIFPGFVSHALLPALYAESTAFLFPSLYEGFGLPPLEAMACNTPVVASNCSSMPELLGDAFVPVNPESVLDIARGMTSILQYPAIAQNMSERALAHVKQYRWDIAAQEHIRVYERALE